MDTTTPDKLPVDLPEDKPKNGNDDYKPEYCKQIVTWFELKRLEGMPAHFQDFCKTIKSTDPKCFTGHISRETLRRWADRYPEFCCAYTICEHESELNLVDGGLLKRYEAGFVFRALKNKHGWRDETQVQNDVHMNAVIRLPAMRNLGDPIPDTDTPTT